MCITLHVIHNANNDEGTTQLFWGCVVVVVAVVVVVDTVVVVDVVDIVVVGVSDVVVALVVFTDCNIVKLQGSRAKLRVDFTFT